MNLSTKSQLSSVPHETSTGVNRLWLLIAATIIGTMAPTDALARTRLSPSARQPEITNLENANVIANALATSYTECRINKTHLSKESLTHACNDYKRVTRFGSRYGQGENPTDAWGNTIDWTDLAKWLGLQDWLNDYIADQARKIQDQQLSGRSSTARISNPSRQQQNSAPQSLKSLTPQCMIDDKMQKTQLAKVQPAFQSIKMPKGGTLFVVAQFYGTTVAKLQLWNNISDVTKVREGQMIRFRPGVK